VAETEFEDELVSEDVSVLELLDVEEEDSEEDSEADCDGFTERETVEVDDPDEDSDALLLDVTDSVIEPEFELLELSVPVFV